MYILAFSCNTRENLSTIHKRTTTRCTHGWKMRGTSAMLPRKRSIKQMYISQIEWTRTTWSRTERIINLTQANKQMERIINLTQADKQMERIRQKHKRQQISTRLDLRCTNDNCPLIIRRMDSLRDFPEVFDGWPSWEQVHSLIARYHIERI